MKQPAAMPTLYVASQEFELQRVDFASPEASGRIGGVQVGFPLWTGVWTLGRMPIDNSDEWRAWLSGMRGATRRFIGYDLSRLYPKTYPTGFGGMTRAGGGSFDGTATSWSETITADGDSQPTLHGLPAGFVLSQGDYIGFHWVATETAVAGLIWHAPVRVITGGTANGTGDLTVTSEPPIPSAVPGTAIAYLNNPGCTMALDLSQTSLGAVDPMQSITGGQITGVQDIRS